MEEEDFAATADSEEESLESFDFVDAEDENVGRVSDDEKCGICMETIIDRGILDCCHDWFCFACIENWASITNFCPLCQGEFQLITCVPVYDTIGSCNLEEDSLLTDEDWSIEGKSSSLSFPSYYIDENAVKCLDGDGCKFRSKSATLEEDPNLDTSIACDSCDTWYHAFCVEFDPEATSENTWLCPRCLVVEMKGNSETTSLECFSPVNGGVGCIVDAAFSGTVSVSVADIGETAVVVSLVGEKYRTDKAGVNLDSTLESESNLKSGNLLSSSGAKRLEFSPKESSDILQNPEVQKIIDLPISQVDFESKTTGFDKAVYEPNGLNEFVVPPSDDYFAAELPQSNAYGIMHDDEAKNKVTGNEVQYHPSFEDILSVNEKEHDARKDVSNADIKRKPILYSANGSSSKDDRNVKAKTGVCAKKIKATQKTQMIDSEDPTNPFSSDVTTENAALNIFSIVRGTHRKTTDETSYKKGNESGLRMKKIMRRAREDTESSVQVQKLREEIRGFVHNKPSAIFGKTLLDPELLSAFRTAIAGSHGDAVQNKKVSTSVVRVKKPMLQKGSIREKLTKKIYGTCGGKRKRAWDRECEIEFWKHRCIKSTKPEKVETLKSVLEVLRGTVDNQKNMSKGDGSNLILSRLYLADNSVFPRDDNIRPVLNRNNEHSCKEKGMKSAVNNCAVKKIADSSGKKGLCGSVLANSKSNSKKESVAMSSDRSDKRKWALEVLARKTATAGKKEDPAPEKDFARIKGNYPLLIQLPVNMRPVLAPTRHNKIPTSVRQAQLYRLTEHLLRKANLPLISRFGVAELAVADAISIEKEAAERSSSKLVYINLCSQEISHRSTHNTVIQEAMETDSPLLPTPVSEDKLQEENIRISSEFNPLVQESLRKAGLLFDSPPPSPVQTTNANEGANSMFEIHSKDEVSNALSAPELSNQLPEAGDWQTLKPDLEGKTIKPEVENLQTLKPDSEGQTLKPEVGDLQTLKPDLEGKSIKPEFGDLQTLKPDLEDKTLKPEVGDLQTLKPDLEGKTLKPKIGDFQTLKPDLEGQTLKPKVGDLQTLKPDLEGKTLKPEIGDLQTLKSYSESKTLKPKVEDSQTLKQDLEGETGDCEGVAECDDLSSQNKEPHFRKLPDLASKDIYELVHPVASSKRTESSESKNCGKNQKPLSVGSNSSGQETSPKDTPKKKKIRSNIDRSFKGNSSAVYKKVEAYIKEHIRPLCRSGVITVEQYKFCVGKASNKVMRYHLRDKNANFLIKEGEKVKKLAQQYVEASQHLKGTQSK